MFYTLSEHRISRGFAGFWKENRKLFYVSTSEVPFLITNKDVGIEIIDPLSADILGMVFRIGIISLNQIKLSVNIYDTLLRINQCSKI